jgi:hypothetical protein
MLTRQFRVGPLPSSEMYDQFLAPIRRFVASGKPIRVTVGYGICERAVSSRRSGSPIG